MMWYKYSFILHFKEFNLYWEFKLWTYLGSAYWNKPTAFMASWLPSKHTRAPPSSEACLDNLDNSRIHESSLAPRSNISPTWIHIVVPPHHFGFLNAVFVIRRERGKKYILGSKLRKCRKVKRRYPHSFIVKHKKKKLYIYLLTTKMVTTSLWLSLGTVSIWTNLHVHHRRIQFSDAIAYFLTVVYHPVRCC